MAETNTSRQEEVVKDLSGSVEDVAEIESLCMNCHDQGMTRILPTRIPFFRDVLISSFICDHCQYKNTELMPIGDMQDKGIKIDVLIKTKQDLNRQVVITSSATVKIPDVELDIPPSKGTLTTAEGIIQRTMDDLAFQQPVRRAMSPETADKIDEFIARLERLKTLEAPFTINVDDPSGNSFIENPAPRKDPQMTVTHYQRTTAQTEALGFQVEEPSAPTQGGTAEKTGDGMGVSIDEVITFQVPCSHCKEMIETHMKRVAIPHFKEVIIMASSCDKCGHRENEVKSGTGIEPKGRKITLKITDVSDLSRDVLKSDMSSLNIPELDFESEAGTLGGRFTTIEGLLNNVKDQLKVSTPFVTGDSTVPARRTALDAFCQDLDQVIEGKRLNVHFVLDDPSGNSYIQNVYAPDDDPEMEIVDYERNYDQKELLGLNDMKTENYGEQS